MRPVTSFAPFALCALLAPIEARAADPIEAAASCTVIISSLVFPGYDAITRGGASAIGTVTVVCPPGTASVSPRIVMSNGRSGRFSDRRMTSGTDSLRYNLFLEPSHVRVIGDGTDGSVALTSANIRSQGRSVYTIHGVIFPGQSVSPGQYSDDITVQLEF